MRHITKAEAIAEEIKSGIVAGRFAGGSRLPTERDFAKLMGASQLTVSKAIAMLAAEGLIDKRQGSGNYVTGKGGGSVCFVMEAEGDARNPIWHSIYEAFHFAALNSGIETSLCIVPGGSVKIDSWGLKGADAIVAGLSLDEWRVDWLRREGKPVVWLEEYDMPLPGASVFFDNFEAGRMAAAHLYEVGRRHPLFLKCEMSADSPSHEYCPARRRREGFLKGFGERGVSNCPSLSVNFSHGQVNPALRDYLASHPEVDGILCFSDGMTPGAVRSAAACGRSVPGDIALIGIDGMAFCKSFIPSLSSVRQPVERIGELAFGLVRELLSGGSLHERSIPLPPELIVRESSSALTMMEA